MTPVQTLLAKLLTLGCPEPEAMELIMAVVQCGKVDQAAEKRRKWDREYRRKKKLSGGNPPECKSGGIQVELPANQVEIHPTNAVILTSTNSNISNGNTSIGTTSNGTNTNGTISNGGLLGIEFEQIWKIYPNKKSKKESLRAFQKARKKVSLEAITDGLYAYIQNTDQQFLAHLATWLNQERWNDEYAAVTSLFPAKPLSNFQLREKTRAASLAALLDGTIQIDQDGFNYGSANGSAIRGPTHRALSEPEPDSGISAGGHGNVYDLPPKSSQGGV